MVRGGVFDFGDVVDRHRVAGSAAAGARHLRREAGPCRPWTVLHPRRLPDDRVSLLPASGLALTARASAAALLLARKHAAAVAIRRDVTGGIGREEAGRLQHEAGIFDRHDREILGL